MGKTINASLGQQARTTVVNEVHPIDDIRSTSAYRTAVLGNLIAEFLQKLASRPQKA